MSFYDDHHPGTPVRVTSAPRDYEPVGFFPWAWLTDTALGSRLSHGTRAQIARTLGILDTDGGAAL